LATYSNQLVRLNSVLNNLKELNNIDKYKIIMEYILIKVYIKIKGNAIFIIIDTRVYMLVITKLLAQALSLK